VPGDEFSIIYNNQEYRYVVEYAEEVPPADVQPLAEIKPKYLNESTVVLMTCSPPGTKLKRLLVGGVLVN
jgi:LPXTG-site transpeptidase (sortase) family protein